MGIVESFGSGRLNRFGGSELGVRVVLRYLWGGVGEGKGPVGGGSRMVPVTREAPEGALL